MLNKIYLSEDLASIILLLFQIDMRNNKKSRIDDFLLDVEIERYYFNMYLGTNADKNPNQVISIDSKKLSKIMKQVKEDCLDLIPNDSLLDFLQNIKVDKSKLKKYQLLQR